MATAYLRYHYVIDIITGFFHTSFCIWAGPRVNDLWYKYVTGDHVMDEYPEKFNVVDKVKRILKGLKDKV